MLMNVTNVKEIEQMHVWGIQSQLKKVLNAGTNCTYNYEHEPKDDSLCQVLQKACLEQLLCELQDVIVDVALNTDEINHNG